ncbi:MAG: DUF1559 domain-containing protein [Planctomycetaceae bacterium]
MTPTDARQGFTQLELLVVISVLSLLLVLILPAVQQARAAARRAECTNRLKQLGLVIHNRVELDGRFPNSRRGTKNPYALMQETLGVPEFDSRNKRVLQAFQCPADPWSTPTVLSPNYVLNDGTDYRYSDSPTGYSRYRQDLKPADIVDGQSNTVAISERLVPLPPGLTVWDPNQIPFEDKRHLWWTTRVIPLGPQAARQMAQDCLNQRATATPVGYFNTFSAGGYDHLLPPNAKGCFNGPATQATGDQFIAPATSNHHGGVNALFIDGHVTFVSENIDTEVWRALGTVAGNETVSNGY